MANHVPLNARIIGANEHESHYVFDLLYNNTTDIQPMDRTSLTMALEKIVNLGWLDPAERIGKTDRYRLSDAALANELFLHNVERRALAYKITRICLVP